MEFLEAKAIAERLGFQLFADVRGDTNALRLFTLKTVESTLSQIRRRRARGTSGLWPSSP